MSAADVTAFSDQQQAAVFGHALRDPNLWYKLDILGITKEWFLNARLAEAFDHIQDHRSRLGRPPSGPELVEHAAARQGEDMRAAAQRTVVWCLKQSNNLALDLLNAKMLEWAKSRVLAQHTSEVAKLYNAGDHPGAQRAAEAQALALHKLAVQTGTSDCFIPSNTRIKGEAARRAKENEGKLRYGISFFDDALTRIRSKDLIILSARAGAGKTEAAKMIAEYNARLGYRVSFFALEAEEDEIERRIKYGMIAREYLRTHDGVEEGLLNYADWLNGGLEAELGCYDDWAEERFDKELSTLKTFYRVRGDFRVEDLDREVWRVHKDSDLVVLDHIHYVDLDGDDENREMNRLMKKLRDLALSLAVPILCVAHLRKNKGKAHALLPDFEDIHGASGISKIATVALIMAPAGGAVASPDSRAVGSPTFMRIVKFRAGGDRLNKVAVSYFNPAAGNYNEEYAIGHLNFSETKWSPAGTRPRWAKSAVIEDISEAS